MAFEIVIIYDIMGCKKFIDDEYLFVVANAETLHMQNYKRFSFGYTRYYGGGLFNDRRHFKCPNNWLSIASVNFYIHFYKHHSRTMY